MVDAAGIEYVLNKAGLYVDTAVETGDVVVALAPPAPSNRVDAIVNAMRKKCFEVDFGQTAGTIGLTGDRYKWKVKRVRVNDLLAKWSDALQKYHTAVQRYVDVNGGQLGNAQLTAQELSAALKAAVGADPAGTWVMAQSMSVAEAVAAVWVNGVVAKRKDRGEVQRFSYPFKETGTAVSVYALLPVVRTVGGGGLANKKLYLVCYPDSGDVPGVVAHARDAAGTRFDVVAFTGHPYELVAALYTRDDVPDAQVGVMPIGDMIGPSTIFPDYNSEWSLYSVAAARQFGVVDNRPPQAANAPPPPPAPPVLPAMQRVLRSKFFNETQDYDGVTHKRRRLNVAQLIA